MASPVSTQRRRHQKGRLDLAISPALSPEESKFLGSGRISTGRGGGKAKEKPERWRVSAGRAPAEREASSGPRETPRRPGGRVRGPRPRPLGLFPRGHPRRPPHDWFAQPSQETPVAKGRGGHAVTHGPLTNPRMRPSPERVRGGPAPAAAAAAAGVRRPTWRGSLRQAARPGNRVRRAGRGSRLTLTSRVACTLRRGPCGMEARARA